MLRATLFLVVASCALGACGSHGGPYNPPVDPMLPGDGYHLKVGPTNCTDVLLVTCQAPR
ncbi:MAG TPA: hypothetical protein VLV45_07595 [Gemmatimonadales bacterium]|nr:hypothetical protein [Gemmatimonadales bacterium]